MTLPEVRRPPPGAKPTPWTPSSIRPGISTATAIRATISMPFDPAKIAYWFPIDQYIGGVEHAILHLIYSRFFTKVMRDMGLVTQRRARRAAVHAGHGDRGRSQDVEDRRATWWAPTEVADRYGADTARMFVLFAAPPEKEMDWRDAGVEGIHRFLGRVYRFVTRNVGNAGDGAGSGRQAGAAQAASDLRRRSPRISKRAGTSIPRSPRIMELVNELYAREAEISPAAP